MNKAHQQYCGAHDAAKYLGIKPMKLYRLAKEHKIARHHRPGVEHDVFKWEELYAYKAEQEALRNAPHQPVFVEPNPPPSQAVIGLSREWVHKAVTRAKGFNAALVNDLINKWLGPEGPYDSDDVQLFFEVIEADQAKLIPHPQPTPPQNATGISKKPTSPKEQVVGNENGKSMNAGTAMVGRVKQENGESMNAGTAMVGRGKQENGESMNEDKAWECLINNLTSAQFDKVRRAVEARFKKEAGPPADIFGLKAWLKDRFPKNPSERIKLVDELAKNGTTDEQKQILSQLKFLMGLGVEEAVRKFFDP